jgi:GntR family transcriptional regulator of vanillate catabolism
MASQIERVCSELRRRVMAGELPPGERLVELALAAELGVSRTPLRLAFGELEKEGLLVRLPTRGFRVRRVTLDEVAQAIDVRGVLEGMAARAVAEAGVGAHVLNELKACVAEGQDVLQAAAGGPVDAIRWAAMNARFHRTLAEAAENPILDSALAHVAKTPMAAPNALGISGIHPALEFAFLQRAQFDHEDVVHAIQSREGARAEALMREHARRSRDNKRMLMQQPEVGHAPARTSLAA